MTAERMERLNVLMEQMRRQDYLDGSDYWEMVELQEEFEQAEQCDTEKPSVDNRTPLLPPP